MAGNGVQTSCSGGFSGSSGRGMASDGGTGQGRA